MGLKLGISSVWKEWWRKKVGEDFERKLQAGNSKTGSGLSFDPKHTLLLVKNYLRRTKVNIVDQPAQSPDLNHIKNLWCELQTKFHARRPSVLEQLAHWRRMHLNCPGCVKDFIRKYNCYKCSLLPGKRVHNWWLASGWLIYSEPGSFWLLCNVFVSVSKIK